MGRALLGRNVDSQRAIANGAENDHFLLIRLACRWRATILGSGGTDGACPSPTSSLGPGQSTAWGASPDGALNRVCGIVATAIGCPLRSATAVLGSGRAGEGNRTPIFGLGSQRLSHWTTPARSRECI